MAKMRDTARMRAGRLAGRGYPVSGNRRLAPKFLEPLGEESGSSSFSLEKETSPTAGELAAIDKATARRARARRSRNANY